MTNTTNDYWTRHNAIVEKLLSRMDLDEFPSHDEARATANDTVNNAYVDDITDDEWLTEAGRRLGL